MTARERLSFSDAKAAVLSPVAWVAIDI